MTVEAHINPLLELWGQVMKPRITSGCVDMLVCCANHYNDNDGLKCLQEVASRTLELLHSEISAYRICPVKTFLRGSSASYLMEQQVSLYYAVYLPQAVAKLPAGLLISLTKKLPHERACTTCQNAAMEAHIPFHVCAAAFPVLHSLDQMAVIDG